MKGCRRDARFDCDSALEAALGFRIADPPDRGLSVRAEEARWDDRRSDSRTSFSD
jgi:hypothetical protein